MNLHSYVANNGFRVEAEPKEVTLRVFDSAGEHIFNCQVTAASLDTARITAGAIMQGKEFDCGLHRAIDEYLTKQGFEFGVIERVNSVGELRVIRRTLKPR
jgi:hypothetical protein